eukprot:TRINITY_DN1491_c0_g1_i2.p1 TRINITY_DN1491_c0_g1~~TRINITY_DN1491_c0_g1_i2.p1  ORF type:complete len:1331 (+),score=449.05 TRINITY_DN1491_c0_g1_i2:287-4279(+)
MEDGVDIGLTNASAGTSLEPVPRGSSGPLPPLVERRGSLAGYDNRPVLPPTISLTSPRSTMALPPADSKVSADNKKKRAWWCWPTSEAEANRMVLIDDPVGNAPSKFRDNHISTSKYTWWNFFFKNLFEQFMRLANMYFIFISLLQQIPGVSPTGQWSTLGPLAAVMLVTMVKEAFEDVKRHRADVAENTRLTNVLREGKLSKVEWQQIRVGDIVRLSANEFIPADVVLLSSSEPMSIAYIETANLDGETNLKIRQALPATAEIADPSATGIRVTGTVESGPPNNKLYEFEGSIDIRRHKHPLGPQQLLLRGAQVRNTGWLYGLVLFTGRDTKYMQNSNKKTIKRTKVERISNIAVVILFVFELLLAGVCAGINAGWRNINGTKHWYLAFPESESGIGLLYPFLTFIILYNNLIPISLYVTLELAKFGQAYLINNDEKMYHKESNTYAVARTSNLNEELGQVEYIFSDKTGTLTENLMIFRKCSIAGKSYGGDDANLLGTPGIDVPISHKHFAFHDADLGNDMHEGSSRSLVIREFVSLLAVCHSVVPSRDENDPDNIMKIVYQSSSPDEEALVEASNHLGYVFVARTPTEVVVRNPEGVHEHYQLLNMIEFTSSRKRMSVVCRCPDGRIKVFVKGADTVIYERLGPDQPYADACQEHMRLFASEGLRTLCLAVAVISEEAYASWSRLWDEAALAVQGRDKKLEQVAELIETNLSLLGVTAIEDKLQQGVPETISTLMSAGIKVWVLTGDKQETAINIGYSCALLTESQNGIVLNEPSKEFAAQRLSGLLKAFVDSPPPRLPDVPTPDLALVIDGFTLAFALEPDLKADLLRLGTACKAVICCRVSPLQKAQVVSLVRDNLKSITLAVGDGANDVSMIQAAHVGIGISGVEGRQAAQASDYAIAQFSYLQRLLLIHGRWNYRRVSKLIAYCFYRNIVLYITQFWFTIFNGFSGQTLYERWTISMYNVIFTFFPIVAFGLIDQDIAEDVVFAFPQVYVDGIRQGQFNTRVILCWVANAVWHSFLIFMIPMYSSSFDVSDSRGFPMTLDHLGYTVFSCVIMVVTLKIALETRYWSSVNHVFTWVSLGSWFIFMVVYGTIWGWGPTFNVGKETYFVFADLFSSGTYWFVVILTTTCCLWRDVTWKYVERTFLPKPRHILQERQYIHKQKNVVHPFRAQSPVSTLCSTGPSLNARSSRPFHTGFAFSEEEIQLGGAFSTLDLSMKVKETSMQGTGFGARTEWLKRKASQLSRENTTSSELLQIDSIGSTITHHPLPAQQLPSSSSTVVPDDAEIPRAEPSIDNSEPSTGSDGSGSAGSDTSSRKAAELDVNHTS